MRIRFRAVDGGFSADEDAVGFSLSGPDDAGEEHYLNLQRTAEVESADDGGIYLELDDQSNGEYDCVRACRLSGQKLTIDLSKPLGDLSPDVDGFEVSLADLGKEAVDELIAGLPRAFRGFEDRLAIA